MGLPRRSVVLAVVLAVPAVFWLFRAGSPRAARPTAGQTIVALLDGWVYRVAALVYIVGSLVIVVRRYLTVTV